MDSLALTTVDTAKELGLLPSEYDQIKDILGRIPNFTELSVFAVMWSEHCSYKNSIQWLKILPKGKECQFISIHIYYSFNYYIGSATKIAKITQTIKG